MLQVLDPDSSPVELVCSSLGNLSSEAGHLEDTDFPGRLVLQFHKIQQIFRWTLPTSLDYIVAAAGTRLFSQCILTLSIIIQRCSGFFTLSICRNILSTFFVITRVHSDDLNCIESARNEKLTGGPKYISKSSLVSVSWSVVSSGAVAEKCIFFVSENATSHRLADKTIVFVTHMKMSLLKKKKSYCLTLNSREKTGFSALRGIVGPTTMMQLYVKKNNKKKKQETENKT